jgi:tetratricopeptide (TPR) repeat protein
MQGVSKLGKMRAAVRPLIGAMVVLTIVGCAGRSKVKAPPPPSFDTVMAQAEAKVSSVGPDAAIVAFEEAAKIDPIRKEPWVRIAQLQFDRTSYARAIVAAEEVLQRDPDDLVADGVITVAGFRIANQSLQRLQGRGALASDTARKEAEVLASTLRATMGDSILAPEKPKRAATRRRQRSSAVSPTQAQPAANQEHKPASSDPFKSLGGN